MLAQFTLIPLGTKTDSASKILAKAMMPIVKSGLDYKVGPMSTTVEGEWDQITDLINRCRKRVLEDCNRVAITIFIDDRKNAQDRILGKVKSLEKKMGLRLKK